MLTCFYSNRKLNNFFLIMIETFLNQENQSFLITSELNNSSTKIEKCLIKLTLLLYLRLYSIAYNLLKNLIES